MSQVKEKQGQLVLIEKAAQHFDLHLQPRYELDLKFIIVKEHPDAELKMLFMEIFHPFDYHPQAVLFYMQTNNLQTIITNGAGKVVFDLENRTIIFSGYSKSFGNFCPKDVLAITTIFWPEFKIRFENMPGSADEIAISGKISSIKEIAALIDRA
jgi:hypothetical protein